MRLEKSLIGANKMISYTCIPNLRETMQKWGSKSPVKTPTLKSPHPFQIFVSIAAVVHFELALLFSLRQWVF